MSECVIETPFIPHQRPLLAACLLAFLRIAERRHCQARVRSHKRPFREHTFSPITFFFKQISVHPV